jgi:hypothetical protein
MIMHHPTEINAVHQAVRELYPEHKVLAVFSPIYLVELAILLMILVYLILMKFIDGSQRASYGRIRQNGCCQKWKTRIKNLL